MSTVKLEYTSWTNISFHGEIDTGIPWCEWREMSEESRSEEIADQLSQLVDIGPQDDDGEPCDCGLDHDE